MSAIWGAITKNGHIEELSIKMGNKMSKFKLDRTDSIIRDDSFFSCGHQHITPESYNDISPIFDEKKEIIFAADCFLTNRHELIDLITTQNRQYSVEELGSMGDSQIAYIVYSLFGENFVTRLTGVFAFAIYEIKERRLLLYTDHVGQRHLAFFLNENDVFFSQVYAPILTAIGKDNIEINEAWVASAFSDCTADTIKIPEITAYLNIFPVEAGTYTIIDLLTLQKQKIEYWNPIKSVKKTDITDDALMKAHFVDTFRNTVKSMMRTNENMGILLSGGLDSSTVAAFLAAELASEEKKLFSYTSVPVDEYKYTNDSQTVENETNYIWIQQKEYQNIQPSFVKYGKKNVFSSIDSYVSLFSQPIKAIINMPLIDAMNEAAEKDGCRLIFSGGNGNATISYGRLFTYVFQKMRAFRFGEAYKQMNQFCKRFRVSRKHFVKLYCESWISEKLSDAYLTESNYIREDLIRKYRIKPLLRSIHKQRGTGSLDTVNQRKHFCFMPEVFQHMGIYDTYIGLKHGVLCLDPTLSKQMIELCMSMPIDFFVKDGKERRAVRDYMRGYVADSILNNYSARGDQAADFAFCVNRDWKTIGEDVLERLSNPRLKAYLDNRKLEALIEEIKQNSGKLDRGEVAKAAVICSLGSFLDYVDEVKKE